VIAEWLMKVISNIVLSHVVSLIALTSFNVYVFLKDHGAVEKFPPSFPRSPFLAGREAG
jgi:hypothetical protein